MLYIVEKGTKFNKVVGLTSRKFTVESWEKTIIVGNVGRADKLTALLRRENDL